MRLRLIITLFITTILLSGCIHTKRQASSETVDFEKPKINFTLTDEFEFIGNHSKVFKGYLVNKTSNPPMYTDEMYAFSTQNDESIVEKGIAIEICTWNSTRIRWENTLFKKEYLERGFVDIDGTRHEYTITHREIPQEYLDIANENGLHANGFYLCKAAGKIYSKSMKYYIAYCEKTDGAPDEWQDKSLLSENQKNRLKEFKNSSNSFFESIKMSE